MPQMVDPSSTFKLPTTKKKEEKPKTAALAQPKTPAPAQPKPVAQAIPPAPVPAQPDVSRLVPARTTFEAMGYQVGWKPETKQFTVRDPRSGREVTVTPTALTEGTSWIAPEQVGAIREQLGAAQVPTEQVGAIREQLGAAQVPTEPAYETTAKELRSAWQDFAGTIRSQTSQYFSQMNEYAKQVSDAALTMYKMYQDQLAQAFSLLQQQMQQKPEVPESVKLAIGELRQAVEENSKQLAEEMNRRGILQSGIAAEEERKLRERGMTEEQKLLANWLDQEHEKITRAVFQLANLYAQTAAPSAQMWYQAATAGPQLGMRLAEQAYQTERELAGKEFDFLSKLRQWEAEQRAAAEEAAAQREFETWKTLLPYQYLTKEQQAQLELDYARLAETVKHNRAMERLQAEANKQRADYYGWLKEKGVTEQEVAKNTADAVASILNKPTKEAAQLFLIDQAQHWASDKPVNIAQVLAAMKYQFPSLTLPPELEMLARAMLSFQSQQSQPQGRNP